MFDKRLIVILAAAVSLSPMTAPRQSQTTDDDEFIRKHQFDVVKVSYERLDDYAITRVFRNPVYHLPVAMKEGYGQGSRWADLVATRVGDELVPVPRPMRDGDSADLLVMLRPEFKITNGDVAETLQRALDLIFPIFSSDSKWSERFRHDGNQWTFVRGRSMGAQTGPEQFVLTTYDQATITAFDMVEMLPSRRSRCRRTKACD
jgi:hypothetical protein